MSKAGDLISRVYTGFRGVDFRGDEINLVRSPDSVNMWKDYTETDSIRTRPGMQLKVAFPASVFGVFFYNDTMLVHSGSNLYKVSSGGAKTILRNDLEKAKSNAFVYDGIWYFKDGKHYLQYDGETLKSVEGYIPTTSIARKPMGGGTQYEDVNMLATHRKNSFIADGMSFTFVLDTRNIDSDFEPVVMVDGNIVTEGYTVDYAEGSITFTNIAPDAPATDGQDNVVIEFKKEVPGYREYIEKCTLLQMFDNRVFFSGNPDSPNTLWHCSLNDPSYVSDLDFYREGMDSAKIKGLVAGNNALWVFREPSDANTNVFYHTPTIDEQYGKIYPSSHSSVSTGCVGSAVNFNDDILFFSDRGMEGISGDITTEQVVAHRSTMVDRKLIAETQYKSMILEEWNGYLLVCIGSHVYLADSRAKFSNNDHMEYDWFYWELEKPVTATREYRGVLYIGTEDGVYTLTDNESYVESWWTTPIDKFKNPQKLKTSNKRGCVAEATGDVDIYAKTDKTEFELISRHEAVSDYFVSRVKRKKWKDIQLKFYSTKRFSIESITLEAYVGGYIKR